MTCATGQPFAVRARGLAFTQCLHEGADTIGDYVRKHGRWTGCDTLASTWERPEVAAGGGVFVDVGANIGSCTLLMLALGATVHAFEPVPDIVRLLNASVRANPGFADRVVVKQLALGARPQRAASLFVQARNSGNAVLHVPVPDRATDQMHAPIRVEVTVNRRSDDILDDAQKLETANKDNPTT